jgi:two-component system, cell cycle response regulator DivK
MSITVLYVEDNPDNRLLVRRVLMADGFNVMEACNAGQALQALGEVLPDIILMDINMPDTDGYTLTARLKALPGVQKIPIIAVTANALKGDKERSLAAGCDGYIEKPIDIDTLSENVQRFIADAQRKARSRAEKQA